MLKKEARTKIKERLAELQFPQKNVMDEQIYDKVIAKFPQMSAICIYNALDEEVATRLLISYYMQHAKVYLPVIENEDIFLVELLPNSEFTQGAFQIYEPIGERLFPSEVNLDLCITPLLGFDGFCNRLGKGKGYYDRFFTKTNKECLKVGIGYDCQRADNFDTHEFDIQLDMVITENEIVEKQV